MEGNRINSKQYWERRHATGDWEKNNGQKQTRYFYFLLTSMLPNWFKATVRKNQDTVVDFGCAQGEGVPLLSAELSTKIKGVDFSQSAIACAKEKFPQFDFAVEDVWQLSDPADVSVLSNIIEHFPNPFVLLDTVAAITRKYMIVMVPLEEKDLMGEHCFTFLYQNIPMQVRDFQLIHFAEHDCRKDAEQLFLAKQILLIYSRDQEMNQDLTIEQMDGLISLRKRQQQEIDLQTKLERLNQQNQEVQDLLRSLMEKESEWKDSSQRITVQAAVEECLQLIEREKNHQELVRNHQELEKNHQELENQYQDIEQKYTELGAQFQQLQGTEQKYAELTEQFYLLNHSYEIVSAENALIKNSRMYRIAEKEKALLRRLHLIEPLKFALAVRRNGFSESLRRKKLRKEAEELQNTKQHIFGEEISSKQISPTVSVMLDLKKTCQEKLHSTWNETTKQLAQLIGQSGQKGIVVYPNAVHWEPMQRPQHFLRAFAKEGFLCFFCEWHTDGSGVREVEKNVYIVYGEEFLLPALQDQCPIVLVTYHKQTVFCDLLAHKLVWFDVLDNLDFFAGSTESIVPKIYETLVKSADLVTYSADHLQQYVQERNDAFQLNNGVYLDDFLVPETGYQPIPQMERIKARGCKIIGYYGAVEEWFDVDAVAAILKKTEFEVVLIGRKGIDLSKIQNERLHLIEAVPYRKLKHYARYFDIALIPFVVNKLTNSVSPVKFFEYAAQGIPVVSSNIHEMQQYQGDYVQIYHDYDELISSLDLLKRDDAASRTLCAIAGSNTWEMRIKKVMAQMERKAECLRVMADTTGFGGVCVETVTFFKYDGTSYYSGGAERYLLDLGEVCAELGIQYRIYQYAEYDWVRFFQNIEVVGLGAVKNDVNSFTQPLREEMAEQFSRAATRDGALNIYSPFYILTKKDIVPSVGISHGISWDSEYNHYTDGNTFWQVNKNIIDAASYCDNMISVDTNTCNWFQTLDYGTGRKIKYIPNYVNTKEFQPPKDHAAPRNKTVITYPRRLYGARGLYVVLDIVDDILASYADVEFHFVGKGFEADTKHVEKKVKRWGGRVKWYSKSPDTMYEVYRDTDIALIPTMYSEGTSLSCLEALASGNAVIATRVGGLTDLVLNGYNGILTEPDAESLKYAIKDLLDNPNKMRSIRENAVQTAQAFSKEQWKKHWKEVILAMTHGKETKPYKQAVRCLFTLHSIQELNNEEVAAAVRERLECGKYVYIACKNNPLKRKSYKRLQFIEQEEELYFEPEEIVQISACGKLSDTKGPSEGTYEDEI